MPKEIYVPTLGESVVEATVGKWLKKVGDKVVVDEPLLELETDKVTIEVPCPVSGVLSEALVKVGDIVKPRSCVGFIAEQEEGSVSSFSQESVSTSNPMSANLSSTPTENNSTTMPPAPSAARLMEEKGILASDIKGSGKRGQILKKDVLDSVAPAALTSSMAQASSRCQFEEDMSDTRRVPMTRLRQTIAQRLKEAQNTAAMLTTFNEVDMKPVMDLRARYKDIFEKKHGVKLGFMGFFTRAVTYALSEIPVLNAEIDGTDIIYRNYCHISVAVSTEQGLVVPVVRNAHEMSIAEIEKEIGRLGLAARNRQLSISDMQGGTFTISNGGVYGSLMSTPILNTPQSGILGMHKIQERPIAIGKEIVIRPMMYLALSYDHRIVDGKEAVLFLVRIKETLEDPERLILDL